MYNNLTLYYLNQIGINPWINKENSSNLINKVQDTVQSSYKMVVLIQSDLSGKAESLLKKMLAYLNLDSNELLMIPIKETNLVDLNQNEGIGQLDNQNPSAIMVFGLDSAEFLSKLKLSCHVFNSFSPEYLLLYPSDKRKAFQDLNAIKTFITLN